MRTLLAGERATTQAARLTYHGKLEVQNGSGTWKDYSALLGGHYTIGATWGEEQDTPVGQASFRIARKRGAHSLAPFMSTSALNVDDLGAYSPALDIGRLVRYSVATLAAGVEPVSGDYREAFTGRINKVQWESDPIVISCSDLGAWLMDTQIEVDARRYGTTAGVALETVLQQIVTDNPDGSGIPVTVYTPTSPGFNVTDLTVGRPKVLEAVRATALDSTAWDVRYRYDASHVSRLTLFNPDRTRSSVDTTITTNEYRAIRGLSLSLANVRNAGKLPYTDASGAPQSVTASDPASIVNRYRRRYFELPSSPSIRTSAEATTLLEAVINDLAGAPAEQEVDCWFLWFVQLYDRYVFAANGTHYDQAQTMSVVGYQHTIENGKGSTVLTCTGRVVGAYADWLRRITLSTAPELQLNNFKWSDANDTSRTYAWTRGPDVTMVLVFVAQVAIGGGDGWPGATTMPTAILQPGTDSYTIPKPSAGYQTFAQFEPRTVTGAAGAVRRAVLDPAPSALTGNIKASVTNNIADLTLTIGASASNWPVAVALYEDDPAGTPIYATSLSAAATITKLTAGASALGGRALPLREVRRWSLKLTDVAGVVVWAFSSADRNPLPNGSVTPSDYKAAPALACDYDDDTDTIRVTVPGGKTKTFSGLTGGGVATYTVGSLLDDSTAESAFATDETRAGYKVEFQGGGEWRTFYNGPLHGAPAKGPSLDVVATPGTATYSVVYTASGGTVQLSINGGAYSTAPASPITVTRPAAGGVPLEYTFRMNAGGQTVTDMVTIQPIDADTSTADLVVTPSTPTDATQTFVASATNPKSGGTAPTIFYTLRGCTAGGGTIAAGTYSYTAGTPVVVDRPAFGTSAQASIEFTATVPFGGAETIQRTILNQVKTNFGPSLTVTATPGSGSYSVAWTGTGTITLSIDGGADATPPASPITVTRNSSDHTYRFKAVLDGQTMTSMVTIPALSGAPTGTGFFVSVSQALYSTTTDEVQFTWSWSGSSAYYQVYVRETTVGTGSDFTTGWFHPGDTTTGATSYLYHSAQNLNGGFAPSVTIEFFLRAMTPGGPSITESDRNSFSYGIV
jgi:hypothetical protein